MIAHIKLLSCVMFVCCKQMYMAQQDAPEDFTKATCLPAILDKITEKLGWTCATIIHDKLGAYVCPGSIRQQRYNTDVMDTHRVLHNIHTSSPTDMNIIIAVNHTKIQSVVKQIDDYDFTSNESTDYRHHSKILILSLNTDAMTTLSGFTQNVENLAVLVVKKRKHCDPWWAEMDMYTLHIHPSKREFSTVTITNNTSSLQDEVFPNLKYGYNNRRILVTTLASKPYVLKETFNDTVVYTGYVFDIWKIIARKLNISYDVTEPADQDWGILENGQWNGIVRQLTKRVDIAVADLSVSRERALYIDFIYPTVMMDESDIIYRRQPSWYKTFFLFLCPLRVEVYLTFLTVGVGTVLLFFVLDQYRSLCTTSYTGIQGLCSKLSAILWNFIGIIFRQDSNFNHKDNAGKLLFFSWCLLVLLITSVYSANLIAALSTQADLSKLSSVRELVESDYTAGVYGAGVIYGALKVSNRSNQKSLYSKMVESSKYDPEIFLIDLDRQMEKVKNEKHAFVTYKSSAALYMAGDCSLALIGEPVIWAEDYVTMALPKGSPLKSDVEKIMYSLQESGILEILWKKWITSNSTINCVVDKQVTAITMREVTGGFLVTCGGVGLAFLVLTTEIIIRRAYRVLNL